MAKLELEIQDGQGRVLYCAYLDTDTDLFLCLLEADSLPESIRETILQAADDELQAPTTTPKADPVCGDPICDDPQCGGPWAKPYNDTEPTATTED